MFQMKQMKIKDDVDLWKLTKPPFNFTFAVDHLSTSRYNANFYCKKVYTGNDNDDKTFYMIKEFDRIIRLPRLDGALDDTLYTLIINDLVEVVETDGNSKVW